MSEHITPPEGTAQQDAIDINDFVYAATGARVRRLTMEDGTYWFPAADVLGELGYTNPTKTLADHVPEEYRTSLGTLTTRYGSMVPAGHGFKKSMSMVNLTGLTMLVFGATKPETKPFKMWVAEVIITVQRDGSYALPTAPIAVAGREVPMLPDQLVDAIVRLEERNARLDEEFAAAQREAQETRMAMLRTQHGMARAMDRIADSLDSMAARFGGLREDPQQELRRLTAEMVLSEWKTRMSVTEDVWAVAIAIAPILAERGEIRLTLEAIADRTGLTIHRVNECLRFMRKHACIRSLGGTPEGAPIYVLNRP